MIRLLHLSDLHFGPQSRLAGQDHARAGRAFHRALRDVEPSLDAGRKIDFVVVTGDLAEVGKPKEFALAYEFLRALAGELGIEPRRFVFCPGNHDVSRALSQKAELDQAIEEFDDAELRRRIDAVKLEFFGNFVQAFYGEARDSVAQGLGYGAYVHSYPDLQLSIAALNSCEKESHRSGDHVGFLGAEQAQALMDFWRSGSVRSALKVVAVHHNPSTTVAANVDGWRQWLQGQQLSADQIAAWEGDVLGFEGKEWLRRIVEDCEVQLVLHGHHHAKGEHMWPWKGTGGAHVLSAGSLSLVADKLPGSEPASFRLIDLETAEQQVTAKAFVWVDWARSLGEVQQGAFKPDPDGHYQQRLDLPAGFVVAASASESASSTVDRAGLAGFVRTYRTAFRGAYSRWDLANVGVTQIGGATQPIVVGIDEMYVPLRLAETYDLGKLDQGRVMLPEDLLRRRRPLAIRGSAGSGKTTWMRWTFRRLLDLEHALPLMLVLRDLAMYWSEVTTGSARSLEAFLDAWAAEQIGSGWQEGYIKRIFEAEDGPTPVLLVDGWDELGPLGEKVRRQLIGLIGLYPRLRVVVSSRPYGEGRPSEVEGFETLELQPLSGGSTGASANGEIGRMVRNFFMRCYRDEEGSKVRSTASFMEALARSVDAQALARNPLLLTMMLLISRSRPLPDKRHDLYEVSIDSLLTARTERKERKGARLLQQQWRPDDADERKRAAASLAHGLQLSQPQAEGRRAIAADWQTAASYLPGEWGPCRKQGFLAWLVGPAGLLVAHSDQTLTFVHLSFQEYLTAWHLDAMIEGAEPRVAMFQQLMSAAYWKETLLLWAARIHKHNPRRLDEVVAVLSDSRAGLCLAGHMFADGVGSEAAFERWAERFFGILDRRLDLAALRVAKAWAFCRQEQRKPLLRAAVQRQASELSWLGYLRCQVWCGWALMSAEMEESSSAARTTRGESAPSGLPLPRLQVARALLAPFYGARPEALSAERVAAGRLLCSGPAFWPPQSDLGMLNVWPGRRRLVGLRLQSLVAAGAPGELLPELAARIIPAPEQDRKWVSEVVGELGERLPAYFAQDFAPAVAQRLANDFATDFAHYLAELFDRQVVASSMRYLDYYFVRYFARYFDCGFSNAFTRDLTDYFARYFASDLGGDLDAYFARFLGLDRECHPWLSNFADIEWKSPGRVAGRALLAAQRSPSASAVVQVLAPACRLGREGGGDPAELEQALVEQGPMVDPLWASLARHLAGRASDEDRTLLEDLARDPASLGEGPLAWGLRFIVRGDVMCPDGSFVELDELCASAGLEPLPLLE
ncbi:MAG: metallophosphoesterase [Acidobacteriota bacterium]